MKIVVTGTRGIPSIEGGVERHCEELYPFIANGKYEVIVTRRSSYAKNDLIEYKGVKIKNIWTPRNKYVEAILHTFLSVVYARCVHADLIHIHAIGPALCVPFARLLGLKVVVTHHGADYEREKWGLFAKRMLRLGEKFAIRYSNKLIAISDSILHSVKYKAPNKNKFVLIPNGITSFPKDINAGYLAKLGLEGKPFLLAVGRLVKEKKFSKLIEAFRMIDNPDLHLIIAGASTGKQGYFHQLKMLAEDDERIHLVGHVNYQELAELYRHTQLFILPSSHEGLPIALLEAMSFGCPVLVSDIKAHIEMGLPKDYYFKCGDEESLHEAIMSKLCNDLPVRIQYDLSKYDWCSIAQATKDVYESLFVDLKTK
jgi:glycosyltransferase involved in cell wall biosynthesis